MNYYEQHISDFLFEFKEVSLEKIGVLKSVGNYVDPETNALPVEFKFDKKAITSPELVDYIAQKTGKSKMLITSDLESHIRQAKEFINIGKSYEIINAGFIKANNKGEYELLPSSQALKAQKNFNKPVTKTRTAKKGSSVLQVITLLIVLAIVAGLGYELYQFFLKPKQQTIAVDSVNATADTTSAANDSVKKTLAVAATEPVKASLTAKTYNDTDIAVIDYIFEKTIDLQRAKERTAQLKNFGNTASFDSTLLNGEKVYNLFIYKETKIADTTAAKDSIAKFLQQNIEIKIASK